MSAIDDILFSPITKKTKRVEITESPASMEADWHPPKVLPEQALTPAEIQLQEQLRQRLFQQQFQPQYYQSLQQAAQNYQGLNQGLGNQFNQTFHSSSPNPTNNLPHRWQHATTEVQYVAKIQDLIDKGRLG